MDKYFYDSNDMSKNPEIYRELILTDSEATTQWAKKYRNVDVQAVTAARIRTTLATEIECGNNEDAKLLFTVLATSRKSTGPHRYDRVIILKRGATDDIDSLGTFIKSWIPRLLEERRLFITHIPEQISDDDYRPFENAIANCELYPP